MTIPALEVVGLAKAYAGQAVLHSLDFRVPPGRLVAILGASGSGKTTLLRLVCGFERLDAGRILLAGRPVAGPGLHVPPEGRRIGYVAQEGALFPHLTVAQNVLFGLPRRERNNAGRAAALLERVGLPPSYAARGPHQLSGGEQQRVALARALAPGPRLVLLDEPFSALDAALRIETRQSVAASLAAARATAVLVTHDQAEALSLGHLVGVLRRGRLVQFDTPDALYHHPVDAELAAFVGEAVLLDGEAAGPVAMCSLGTVSLAAAAHGPVTIMIRPEQLRLGSSGTAATVTAVRFHGADASVNIVLCGGEQLVARVPGRMLPQLGKATTVRVKGAAIAYPRRAPARPGD